MTTPRTSGEYSAVVHDLPLLKFLPPDARDIVANAFVAASFPFGSTIVREGEAADALYVVVDGRARVLKRGENGDELSLNVLRRGDLFGEMGLLERAQRTATVRASSDVEVLRLDRSVFDALVTSRPDLRQYFELQIRHRHLHNFFRQFTAFAALPADALRELLEALAPWEASAGELVVREGDPPGAMFFVEDGRLRVFTDGADGADRANGAGERRYVAYLRKGDFFGERAVFMDEPRSASVEAVTPCRLLALPAEALRGLIARHAGFRRAVEERVAQYDFQHTARIPLDFARELLPADAQVAEKVGPGQVDWTDGATAATAASAASAAAAAPSTNGDGARPAAPAAPAGPFASEDGHFVKAGRRIRRFPHVRQVDAMDCGAASLAMVCRHFGRAVSLARIRQLLHTSTDGTSLRAIVRGAQELGLAARSVKASPRNLEQMPLPAVVHWEGNHWVVLYDVDAKEARVADPGVGLRSIPRAQFEKSWSGYAALFDYTDAFERAPVGKLSVAWLLPFLTPFRGLAAQAAALALIASLLQMALPLFTQVIVDRVLVEHDVGLLNTMIAGMLFVLVFSMASILVQRYLLSFAAVRIDSSTLDFLTRRLLSLPMSYFSTRRTGDIQRRLQGIRLVREFLVQNGVGALTAVAMLIASLGLMLVYSATLTLTFLATTPLYLLLMRYSSKRLRPLYGELEEAFGRYQSFQIDAIKGIETVKSLGAEYAFRELMLNQFNGLARKRFRADFTMMTFDGAVQMVTVLTTTLFLWVGARQVMAGGLSIGALVAFNSLVALANGPILTLLSLWDNLQQVTVYLNRLDDVFEQEPEQGADRSRLVPVRSLEGRVSFRRLGFRYGGPESPAILEDVTVDVPPNTMVAIVGRSGSGKTTLIKCLSGLLEPTEGTILFDGVDLKSLNYRDLRRKIGFVLQENHLFDDTIARNIAFGEEEPDMEKVVWAARAAAAHEFVERLPLGYETKVGESGLSLSGGQKQRLAIARALHNRPPILVFDEATSALDTESERAVKENIDRLLEGRTSFVIAHRLSTVRDADLILVLEKGRLVEQGTHDDLMKRKGLYFYLCSQQLGL